MKTLFLLIAQVILTFNLVYSQSCPEIIFIYADACEAPDGKGEFLYFENGNEAIDVDDISLTFPDGDDICATCNGASACSWCWETPDAASITSLHDAATCEGTVFISKGLGESIPANAKVVIFSNKQFKDDTDWSGFCEETVYVLSINKVANSSKYPHDEDGSSCNMSIANVTLTWGTYTGCNSSQTVNYDPCDLEEEIPSGSGGGNAISFATGIPAYGAIGCDATFSPDLFRNPLLVLPVELNYFKGQERPKSNFLIWETASEENADLFVVERSFNGRDDFTILGFVKAAGNVENIQSYTFEDNEKWPLSYYRLKMVDIDGSFQYSDMIVLERDDQLFNRVSVYPNPVVSENINVMFDASKKETLYISLSNLFGHQLYKEQLRVDEGINYFSIDLDIGKEIQNVYILTIENNESVYNQKILRNNMN